MAMTTKLPPQAYTRETLVKAIEWLSRQPLAVRERATSADLIVSHFLGACRRAEVLNEAPVSGEVFREDLKHLAEDLKKFEDPFAPPQAANRSPSLGHILQQVQEPIFLRPEPKVEPRFEVPSPPQPPHPSPTHHAQPPPSGMNFHVDARSFTAARELQQRLNLSNEVEALRMLVTLGAERARELFC